MKNILFDLTSTQPIRDSKFHGGGRKTVIEYITSLADGGAETLVKDYALLIDKEKFNIIIAIKRPCEASANYKILKEKNVHIEVLQNGKFFSKLLNKILKEKFYSLKLYKLIKKEMPSVIHIHLGILNNLIPISKKLKKVKLFYTCHNEPKQFFSSKNYQEFLAAKKLIKENNLQLIALHSKMSDELNKIFNIRNTIIIKNGVDFNRFKELPETKEEIRKSINIPYNAFVLGHIGRFTQQKNHEYLVSIFEEVSKIKKNAYLLLIGKGELKNHIKNILEQKKLLNKTIMLENRTDIPRLLKAMDIFVFPSFYEGFGNVIVEAQISDIPCVISDSIPSDVILSKKVKCLSIEAPANEWANIILNPEKILSTNYGNINNYDMNNVIKHLEEIYSSDF